MEVINIAQGSQEWLDWRKQGLSASESAVALELSPHKTRWRLWAEKIGRLQPEDLSHNPNVMRGKRKEDKVRELVEKQCGVYGLLPLCAEYSKDRYFRASFDGIGGEDIPEEFKCPHPSTMLKVLKYGCDSAAYKLYWIQVQHQMMVSGGMVGYLTFYCDELTDIPDKYIDPDTKVAWKRFEIERDDDFIYNKLLPEGRAFKLLMDTGTAPRKDPERDTFVPEAQAAVEWRSAAHQWLEVDREYATAKKKLDAANKIRSERGMALAALMGEFASGEYAGVKVTRFTPSGTVDYKAIVNERLALDESALDPYRRTAKQQVRVTSCESEVTDRSLKARKSELIQVASNANDSEATHLADW